MHKITDKQYEEYQRLCYARDHGRILTPDGLRLVCAGFDYDPEAIGKHMLETLAKFQQKETAGEIVSQDSDTEQAYLAFICKRLKLNFRKLSVEERKWLKKIAEKSDLLKNPKPQRGRR